MKKFLALGSLFLLFSLFSCDNKSEDNNTRTRTETTIVTGTKVNTETTTGSTIVTETTRITETRTDVSSATQTSTSKEAQLPWVH